VAIGVLRSWRLIAYVCSVKWIHGQVAVKTGDAPLLFDLFKTLDLRFEDVGDLLGGDSVHLVEISDSSLDDFDQDQGFYDGIASCSDSQVSVEIFLASLC
jgi:hypothetical protein